MRLTETKGIVMATIALDDQEREEFAALSSERIAEKVKVYLSRHFGTELIKDVVVSYEAGPQLIAAIRI
ncbi:MAG: hypothetical protein QJR13_05330 [Bacillota bacterium]|nr:hypothetical protein [Bacillota bacterium]